MYKDEEAIRQDFRAMTEAYVKGERERALELARKLLTFASLDPSRLKDVLYILEQLDG